MIQIKPLISTKYSCHCGGIFSFSELLWQGLHVCEKLVCGDCSNLRINSLPVNQAGIERYVYYPDSGIVSDTEGNTVPDNWFSLKLKSIAKPLNEPVEMNIEIIKKYDEVLILNTLDY